MCFFTTGVIIITCPPLVSISARINLTNSFGVHPLYRFECDGKVAVSGGPKYSANLLQIGPSRSLSGFYSVIEEKQVESVL